MPQHTQNIVRGTSTWQGTRFGQDSPIRGVMAEVKTELLCTTKVIPAPTTMAKYPVSQLSGCGRSATAWP